MHRKKHRKLEAARVMLEDDEQDDKPKGEGSDKNEKAGLSHAIIERFWNRKEGVEVIQKQVK
ncbi:ATP-dependent RNA helicase, partial [Trifolium pratense]